LKEITWIAIASIASSIAVILSAISLLIQRQQFKNANEPLINPIIKRVNVELPRIRCDWETNEKIDKKFSETNLTLLNIGGGLAYDIKYYFEFNNYQEMVKVISKLQMYEDQYFELKCHSFNDHKYEISIKEDNGFVMFTQNQRYIKSLNPLKSGEKAEIPLPSYFMILTNALLRHGNKLGFQFIKELPELLLNIEYKNIMEKKKTKIYLIKWSERRSTKNLTYKYREGQYFDSDIISKSIK